MLTLEKLLTGDQVIVLDGALGTELLRRQVQLSLPLWSAAALGTAPETVGRIHREYRAAGAAIITAGTFRTTSYTYRLAGFDEPEATDRARASTFEALSLAREAAAGAALVAGSLAPVGDCYAIEDYPGREVARRTYRQLSGWLAEAGADLALVETQINLEEALLALEAATVAGLPALVSFLVDEQMCLWSGTPLNEAVQAVHDQGALGVLVNCVTLDIAQKAAEQLAAHTSLPFGLYANAGRSQPAVDGTITRLYPNEQFVASALRWVQLGARLVGGCCGTTPATIRLLRRRLGELALDPTKL